MLTRKVTAGSHGEVPDCPRPPPPPAPGHSDFGLSATRQSMFASPLVLILPMRLALLWTPSVAMRTMWPQQLVTGGARGQSLL